MSRRKGVYLYTYVVEYPEFHEDPSSEARSNRHTLVVRVNWLLADLCLPIQSSIERSTIHTPRVADTCPRESIDDVIISGHTSQREVALGDK